MGSAISKGPLASKVPPMKKKIKKALKAKIKEMEELQKEGREPMNFTRILLKFAVIRKVIQHVQRVFNEYDSDKDGKIDQNELQYALQKLQVELSPQEITDLFQLSDLDQQSTLNLKEFLVALTVGYVLEVIPDLHSEPQSQAQQLAEMSIFIRNAEDEYSIRGNNSMTETHFRNNDGKTVGRKKRRRRSSNFFGLEDEICYVMHLIVTAYLIFDPKGRGYIQKKDVSNAVKEQGKGAGGGAASSFLSEDRWNEMDWDHNGSITFEEFVYAFTRWVDIDDEDEEDFARRAAAPRSRRKSSIKKITQHIGNARRRSSSGSLGGQSSQRFAKIPASSPGRSLEPHSEERSETEDAAVVPEPLLSHSLDSIEK